MRAIFCANCGVGVGVLHTPTPMDIKEALKATPYGALAAMIPPDVPETLASMLGFTCLVCTPIEVSKNGDEEEGGKG